MKIELNLTKEELETLQDIIILHTDSGPVGAEYRSPELNELINKLLIQLDPDH